MIDKGYIVDKVDYELTKPFILTKHYAQRMPSVSYAFGLYLHEELVGVLTIGKPASNSLCKGLLGEEYSSVVYELNRLIVNEGLHKNALSYFVSQALKQLKHLNLAIVSYADTGMNHTGYIYQATNFLYTGITRERTDKYTPNNKHSRHYTDKYKHLRKVRTSKHRYVYFTKDKSLRNKLNYPVLPYPKSPNKRYVLGNRIRTKIYDREKDTYFYE